MRFAPTVDGKRSVIRILSTTPANSYSYVIETEDLILGLKFATVTPLTKKHKFNNTEFGKSFVQVILAANLKKTMKLRYPGDTYGH